MAADWLSDYAAQKAKKDAEDWRKHQQKEDLAGLGWLGLRKAESVLGSAIDGLFGWLDKGINTAWDGAKEFVERSRNLIKDIYYGEGILWENDIERATRIAEKLLSTMQAEGEMGAIDYEKEFKETIFKNKSRLDTEKYLIELEARGIDVTELRKWADDERNRLGIKTNLSDKDQKELEAYRNQVQKEQAMLEEKRKQEFVMMTFMLAGGTPIPIVGDLKNLLDKVLSNPHELNYNEVMELTKNYQQVADSHLAWIMRDVAEYIKDKSDSWFGGFEFDGKLKQQREDLENQLKAFNNQLKALVDKPVENEAKIAEIQKETAKIQASIQAIDEKEKRFNAVKDFFKNKDSVAAANNTVSALCCVLSYYFYGMSEGKIDMSFRDFYLDQVRKGNISMGTHNGNQGAFYYIGSGELNKEWGLKRADVAYDSEKIKQVLQNINGTTAIGWTGGHFYIMKKYNNEWYFMDHANRSFRGEKLDLNDFKHLKRLYQIRY